MRFLHAIFPNCALILLCFSCFPVQGEELYQYRGIAGKRANLFDWQLSKTDVVTIVSKRTGFQITNICQHNGNTVHWKAEGPEISVQAYRSGQQLVIEGEKHGRAITIRKEIGDAPWFQSLSFSLRQFLKSEKKEIVFWSIRFDELAIRRLKAVKKSIREITVETKPVLAQRVEVRLDWPLSFLWQGSYWFRLQDGVFVLYESDHGFPTVDKTTVSLQPKPSNLCQKSSVLTHPLPQPASF